MFKFSELRNVHIEISTRCQASCPMCPRKFHGGVENTNLKIADWTFEEFVEIFNVELLEQLDSIIICGNFGDPIMNDNLIKMCQYVKDGNPEISIRLHTNGGARSTKWWKELYHALPKNHMVYFGIDGLEDTNHIYRIGVNYNIVIKNAQAFIEEGGLAEWVFIKFKHNQHQEQAVEELSKLLGFNRFTVKNTTRFIGENRYSVLNEKGEVEYYLEPPSDNQVVFVDHKMIKNYRSIMEKSDINCVALENKEIYIDAHKNVFPCCFLASTPYHYTPTTPPENETKEIIRGVLGDIQIQYQQLVTSLGGIDKLNSIKYSIKDILLTSEWQTVWNEYWTEKKLITCFRVCGTTKTSKPNDQFVKRIVND
jgi:MoaA/NifB/PqqE/SkfB family radical SAM enzyme